MAKASSLEMRGLLRTTAEAYLDPAVKPSKVNVGKMAKKRGFELDQVGSLKLARYALSTAAIYKLMHTAIDGIGAEAHFVQTRQPRPGVNPLRDLEATVKDAAHTTGVALRSKDERFRYLMVKYVELSKADPLAAVADEEFILNGGDLSGDGSYFVGVTAQNMNESPLTQDLTGDERILATHGLIHIGTGRSTHNIEMLRYLPSWVTEAEQGTKLTERAGGITLLRKDGSRLFSIPREIIDNINPQGPNLHCPAHQPLFDEADTSLELGFHATVNLAGVRDVFDIPNISATDIRPGANISNTA